MKLQDLDSLRTEIAASIAVKQLVLADDALLQQVSELALACVAALRAGGGKDYFCGKRGQFRRCATLVRRIYLSLYG